MKISIIIPVHNNIFGVEQCINSIYLQKFDNFEIIFIDDFSIDSTVKIIKHYQTIDNRIKLIENNKNIGPGLSRNIGIEKSSGDIICFLDSDDSYPLLNIFKDVEEVFIKNSDIDIVGGDLALITKDSVFQKIISSSLNKELKLLRGFVFFKDIQDPWYFQRYFFKSSFLKENSIQFKNGFVMEDVLFMIKVMEKTGKYFHLGYQTYKYITENNYKIRDFINKESRISSSKLCIDRANMLGFTDMSNFLKTDLESFKKYCRNRNIIESSSSPKISIVIPCFNSEKFLSECLDSILMSTFQDFEVICIDDCSTDNTFNILQTYSNNDSRIRIIKNPVNMKQGLSRSIGCANSMGKYLCFVDSDDLVDKNMLKTCFSKMEQTNADILVFNLDTFDNITHSFQNVSWGIHREKISENLMLSTSPNVWHKFFRKSSIDYTYGSDINNGTEDIFFTYMNMFKVSKVIYIDDVLYHYRINLDNSTTSKPGYCLGVFDTIHKMLDFSYRNNLNQDIVNKILQFAEKQFNIYRYKAQDDLDGLTKKYLDCLNYKNQKLSNVIFLVGPYRSGKTSLGKSIADNSDNQYIHIDYDQYAKNILFRKNELVDEFWKTDNWISHELWSDAFHNMKKDIIKLVGEKRNLIISHSFSKTDKNMQILMELFQNAGYRIDILETKNEGRAVGLRKEYGKYDS